jgi:D-tyrosyl-tRNA(Tyr) deacylase
MKIVVQRVSRASCTVDGTVTGSIDQGFMLLVGFGRSDTREIARKQAEKVSKLRIFSDENGKINKNIYHNYRYNAYRYNSCNGNRL